MKTIAIRMQMMKSLHSGLKREISIGERNRKRKMSRVAARNVRRVQKTLKTTTRKSKLKRN